MFILKTLKHHCAGRISPVGRFHIILRLSIFFLLLQLRLPCAPEQSLAWGLGFDSELQVIDDADEDTVFSPNGDGVQDKLLISFAGDGSLGDFRIIIDVHGAGGIGPPDGKFSPDDDWLIKGAIGSGATENDPPKAIRQEWDGKDRSPDQEPPPTARTVRDGTYRIRVEIDAFQDGRVDEIFGYTSNIRSATIDTASPQSSLQVSRREFSPNADGTKDSTQFTYTLSEDLASLQLEFIETNIPAILFHSRSKGRYTYTWKGNDGFGIPLSDGSYNLHLLGSDRAGNIGMFTIGVVTIDTVPPSISQVTPSDNTFQNTPISVIEAIVNPDGGTSIDFTPTSTKITLENENGDSIAGSHNSDESENRLTLTLNSPLDDLDENGVYTVTADALDLAGNNAQRIVNFTFDTNPPIVTKVTANGAELKPGAAIKTPLMFVDAFLADNIALNRNASTIRLNGPKGEVDGVQSPIGENGIRWWLSFPLVADGTDDGTYTLIVTPLDNAANEGSQWQIPFVYDTQPPQLISLLPIEISEPQTFQNTPLSLITAAFDDANGSGVNLDTTTIEMVRHVEEDDWVPEAGALIPDLNNNTLTFRLNQPLQVRDGSQDGTYRVQVSFVDNVGNTQTTDAVLIYDTQAPVLVSTTPGDNETVSSLSKVSVRLNDVSSGVNFSSTTVRLLHEGNEIGVDTSANGQDTVTLTLAKPLATDGSDDGEYTIEIAPADRAGNTGAVRAHRFFLDTRIPEIRLNTPSETQISTLTTIETQLLGYIGPGIHFSPVLQDGVLRRRSTIQVIGPDGRVVPPKEVTTDAENARLIWTIETPLPRDGSADGEYTVSIRYEDFASRAFTEEFTFTFDTQIPTIASTTPSAGDYVSQLNQVLVQFKSDLSDVDLDASQVRLLHPDGTPISSNISDNGRDTIILQFNPLRTDGTADGIYTIEVTSADRAGNVADAPLLLQFTFATQVPEIRLNTPSETQISTLTTIEAQLLGYIGPGIHFSPVLQDGVLRRRSTIQVIGPDGRVVPPKEVTTDAENARLIWTIETPLPRDGSADGEYTVSIRYEDFASRAFTEEFTFTFDTQIPTIASTTPSAGDYVSQLNQVLVQFKSDLSDVDLDASQVRLLHPDGTPISSNISDNGRDTIILQFNPLRTDGTADGIYTIEVTSADRAGNVADAPLLLQFTFATQVPEIRLNTPSETQISTLTTIEAQLLGYIGPGIHFSPVLQDGVLRRRSTIQVIGPDGRVVPPKEVTTDAENARLIWTIETPLPRDGSADGEYTVSIRYEDFASRAFTEEFTFTFDTQIPTIASTTPSAGDYVSQLNQVLVQFKSDLSDVDLDASQVRLLHPDGTPISSNISDNGRDTIILQFNPLRTDGTADGIYTIEVTSADRAGNVAGAPFQFEFTFATRAPEIDALAPADNAIVNRVEEINATLLDHSGEGIDFDHSTIQLQGPNDNTLPGRMRVDKSTSTLTLELDAPLPRNGDADGEYIVQLTVLDKAGNLVEASRTFIYDTQIPQIVSVTANTATPTPIPAERLQFINTSVSEITVIFSDENDEIGQVSGVDFVGTAVRLIAPDDTQVDVHTTDDGVDMMTISFTRLNRSGTYTLEITPRDRAGNVSGHVVPYKFRIELAPPRVDIVTVSGHTVPVEFVNALDAITASLVDVSGVGLDLTSDGSNITVVGPNGEVDGIQSTSGTNEIVWTPLQLASDGTMDGTYTATITPVDSAGAAGVPARHQFIFDTQPPSVMPNVVTPSHVIPLDITGDASNISGLLTQVTVVLGDDSAGIDFDRTSVQLLNLIGEAVPGVLNNDSNATVWWLLDTPLSRNGDADGPYSIRVQAFDKAGNLEGRVFTLRYDTQAPNVHSIRAAQIDGASIDVLFQVPTVITSPIQQLTVVFSDEDGSGMDLSRTTVRLVDPNGDEIGGNQTDDGAGTVFFSFNPLRADGSADGRYRILVTPADLAGNMFTSPIEFPFFYSTQKPEIVSTTPAEFSTATQLTSVSATLLDHSGEGIDFDHSTIQLQGPNDNTLPGRMRVDKSTSTLTLELDAPLPRNGDADGEYIVQLTVLDKAGNLVEASRTFIYDTQIPQIVSVTANTATPTPIPAERLQFINTSVSEITVIFSDENDEIGQVSGVDFVGTAVRLIAPDDTQVDVHTTDDGVDMMTISFTRLNRSGTYTLEITPRDRAGNVSGHVVPYKFRIELAPPRVDIVTVSGHTVPVEFVNALDAITASLVDVSGVGLDLTSDGSNITVVGPNGEVNGIQSTSGTNEIVWTPLQLASDGTMDGTYTATITPVDSAGAAGVPARHQFIFDTQPPSVMPNVVTPSHVIPLDITGDASNISGLLTQVTVVLGDDSAGIDFDRTSVQLLNLIGEAVPGVLNNDSNATVWWLLDTPLSRNGDADGPYSIRVQAFDKAGNLEGRVFTLRYDTQAPNVHSIRAAQIDGASIDVLFQVPTVITSPIQQLTVVFSDEDGSGMDLSRTTVRLVDPNGDEIGGNQTDDGAGTVFFSFNPLRADGSADGRYRILVTPADLAGNMFTSPIEFPFFYSTQKPEIVSTTPAEFSTATQLTSVSATLLDHSGEGIDFDHSTIQLQGPNDNTLPGRMRVDKSTSTLTLELDAPLPRNGDADGEYIVQLTVLDKAGNLVEASRTFIYDTQIPQIVSVTANTATPTPIPAERLQFINTSVSEITVIFSDENDEIGQVSGVDFVGTAVRLIAPDDTQVDVHTTDDGVDMMTISFTRLNRSGTYTLEITPRDRAGNVSGHVVPYKFRIELAPPRVDIVTVSGHTVPVEFVNALDAITASLVDVSGVGLDLTSDGSNITVVGPNGEVDGIQSTSGTNEIVWTPLQLASDGTMDGTYTATITPVDSAGAAGVPARHQFIFDTQPPVMSAIAPINLTQAVSYIGEQISQIAALVVDVGPAGLKIDEQRLHLLDAHGNLISGDLTDDGTELIIFTLSQPLATDGSDDGTYSVVVVLSDNAGNLSGIAHQLVYDTIAPRVQTHPADGEAISDEIRLITADLQDTGDSGIDFGASTLTLLDANGVEIAGEPNNDGRARMMLRIPGLVEDGNYTIRVQAVDRAGNGADTPFMASFLFSSSIPAVVSTVPATSPSEKAFTNRPLRQVEAQLQLDGGVSGRSTIALLAPDDTRVAGIQTEAGSRLVYRLSRPLAADGSDDGMYTISVIPVNRAGRQGSPRQFTFAYDTVPPEVEPDSVSLIVAEPGVNNALNEIQVPVTDDEPSSGIDWDNLAESWLTLEKIETGQQIRGTLYSDGQQTLSFRLTTPLASDGSQDGQYRVTLLAEDRADNVSEPVIYEFFYDTRPPIIITDSLEINDLPLLYDRNRPDYPSATNSSSGVVIRSRLEDITLDGGRGLGVDLSQSMITLRGPDDNPINGSLRQNGVDEIEFKSDALTVEGIYQVAITSVGLDEENLGFQPSDSISMQFLHERTEPVAALTDFGGVTTLENEPIPLKGTAHDPETDEVSASGVLLVEIVGVGPNGIPINSVIAQDESEAEEEPWSRWSLDFLPSQSGVYNLDVRATDRAGNATVVDGVTATFAVSLSFKGSTYAWPNPVRQSAGDTANFSFDVNATDDEVLDVLLSIYDFAGDLVFYEEFQDIRAGRTDQLVTWNLENQSGADVARGVYVFRLEAQRAGAKERTNAIGKILVVE